MLAKEEEPSALAKPAWFGGMRLNTNVLTRMHRPLRGRHFPSKATYEERKSRWNEEQN
jgi:truncated hemoglobin YjbI